jgi:hypothetical protein
MDAVAALRQAAKDVRIAQLAKKLKAKMFYVMNQGQWMANTMPCDVCGTISGMSYNYATKHEGQVGHGDDYLSVCPDCAMDVHNFHRWK